MFLSIVLHSCFRANHIIPKHTEVTKKTINNRKKQLTTLKLKTDYSKGHGRIELLDKQFTELFRYQRSPQVN